MEKVLLVHLGNSGLLWRVIGFGSIPEDPAEILPDKKRPAGNNCTLGFDFHGKPVDMLVAEMADNKNTGGRITHHFPVQAPGDAVDHEIREREIVAAEFALPFNGKFQLLFLCPGQSGTF